MLMRLGQLSPDELEEYRSITVKYHALHVNPQAHTRDETREILQEMWDWWTAYAERHPDMDIGALRDVEALYDSGVVYCSDEDEIS